MARFQVKNRIPRFIKQPRIALAAGIEGSPHRRTAIEKVFHLHRVRSALGFEHAAVFVEFLKELRIQCRGGHNQLEFGASL